MEPVREIEIDDHTSPSTNEKAGFSFEFGDVGSLNTNSRTGSVESIIEQFIYKSTFQIVKFGFPFQHLVILSDDW